MSLKQRVARLKRKIGEPVCPICKGRRIEMHTIEAGDPEPPRKLCPGCGQPPTIRVVARDNYDPRVHGDPR